MSIHQSFEVYVRFKIADNVISKLFVSNQSFSHVWDAINLREKELKEEYPNHTLITEVVNVAESHHVDNPKDDYYEEPQTDCEEE